jgi:1-acyl-sn-glycerol-3-phosphate acyltransferase
LKDNEPVNAWLRHPFRVTGRLIWLALELAWAAVSYVLRCAGKRGRALALTRSRWLQKSSRRVLRVLRMQLHHTGAVPHRGLLVCNHLGYVDILVLASLTPAAFVSKHEVKSWPVFGWFARLAGTVFVHRERPTQTAEANEEIEAALQQDILVILFPEATSSDGKTILPFKSALLESAVRHPRSLTAGYLHYELEDGDAGEEVCYWKDMVLVPHLINLLSKRSVRGEVHFSEVHPTVRDRKHLARQLHAEVSRLKHHHGNAGVRAAVTVR